MNPVNPDKHPDQPQSPLLFLVAMLAPLLLGLSVMAHLDEPIGDEAVHAYQIGWFLEGRMEQFQYVTVVPVYHAAVAGLARIFSLDAHHSLRMVSLLLGVLALPAFFYLTRMLNSTQPRERSLLFLLLPIYFPLYFLVYTDMFSLAAVLLMVERTVARSYRLAGLAALAAVFIRQPNAVWLAYCGLLVLLDTGKLEASAAIVRDYLKRVWPLALAGLAFVLFVLINGGVAVGDTEQHPVSFNPSNVYFMLLTSFVLLLPFCLSRATSVLALLKARPWLILVVLGMYVVFLYTWEHAHIYNARELDFYRHNLVLHTISDHPWLQLLSYLGMAWMVLVILTLVQERRDCPALVYLLPFACLAVLALPLIEPRYYLVFIALLLAMLPPQSQRILLLCGLYYLTAASYILYHISRMHFFL